MNKFEIIFKVKWYLIYKNNIDLILKYTYTYKQYPVFNLTAQNNRNQSPTKGNGSGGNNAPNNDDRSSDRGKNRYQHYDQQRNQERESSSPMVTSATGSETATGTGRSPSPNSISGQNQLISGAGSQQQPQHHHPQQRRDSASSRHNNRRSYSPTRYVQRGFTLASVLFIKRPWFYVLIFGH